MIKSFFIKEIHAFPEASVQTKILDLKQLLSTKSAIYLFQFIFQESAKQTAISSVHIVFSYILLCPLWINKRNGIAIGWDLSGACC